MAVILPAADVPGAAQESTSQDILAAVDGTEALLAAIDANTDGVEGQLTNIYTDMATAAKQDTINASVQKTRKWPYANYDAQVPTFNATQDVWEYKTGGTGGSVVGTITIDYTDATKSVTSSVQYSPEKVV